MSTISLSVMSFSFLVKGLVLPIVSIFGVFGNVVSIIILYNRHGSLCQNSSFKNLLICLAIFDSFFLVLTTFPHAVSLILPIQSNLYSLALPYLIPLSSMFFTGSVYTVVAITVERYATLRQWRSRFFTGRVLIIFIIIFSVCFNFVRFFELTTEQVKVDSDGLDTAEDTYYIGLKPTWLRTHKIYSIVYLYCIRFLVMSLIPVFVLGVLNLLIFKSLTKITQNQSNQNSDGTITALLFSIVIIFLCCHFPRFVIPIYEGFQILFYGSILYLPTFLDIFTHLLLVINSSVNIVIYAAKDLKFRQALFLMFRCKKESTETETMSMINKSTEMTEEDSMFETVY